MKTSTIDRLENIRAQIGNVPDGFLDKYLTHSIIKDRLENIRALIGDVPDDLKERIVGMW